MNTDESELTLFRAERRVREIQAKLHRWADHDPQRDLWSARCSETGTAGAGGGSGKPTGGNTGRAPRADLTVVQGRMGPAMMATAPRTAITKAAAALLLVHAGTTGTSDLRMERYHPLIKGADRTNSSPQSASLGLSSRLIL